MSPTTIFNLGLLLRAVRLVHRGLVRQGGGVPGVVRLGGSRRGTIPGTTQIPSRTHIQSLISLRAYPRPYEGNIRQFDEVSEIGSRKGPEWVPE